MNRCPCAADFQAADVRWIDRDPHLVVQYGEPTRDELVLFFHGNAQLPSNHYNVLSAAAYAGYRVLAVKTRSQPKPIEDCFDDYPYAYDACVNSMSRARLYGSEYGEFVDVDDEDSVVARVYEALVGLHVDSPEDGWDAYFEPAPEGAVLHEEYVQWDRMIVSGFSQGAQKAALLAIEQRFDGVVLLSGPPDDASWVRPGQTSTCVWWAFHHADEVWVDYQGYNYDILGFDEPVDHAVRPLPAETCGGDWPPYGGRHRFSSTLDPLAACPTRGPHGSMANDICMNVDSGYPSDPFTLFRPYLYAFCAAGEVDADRVTGECPPLL